jgi:hypothetical protein
VIKNPCPYFKIPIPPLNLQILNIHEEFSSPIGNYAKFRCLVIQNPCPYFKIPSPLSKPSNFKHPQRNFSPK